MRRHGRLPAFAALLLAIVGITPAVAHDGVDHATSKQALAHPAPGAAAPFPVAIDMVFDLVDHDGRRVTEADFQGRPVALFFGYVSCDAICAVAIPRLVEAIDLLGDHGTEIVPLIITVDPEQDTPAAMRQGLARWGPGLVGLTGSEAALASVRDAFQVEAEVVWTTPDGKPIYAHGSFIYLIGPDGRVRTMVPPILGPERIAYLMGRYLAAEAVVAEPPAPQPAP